jgi:dimethylhistidine N-methyltransferase
MGLPGTDRLSIQAFPITDSYREDIRQGLTATPKFLQPKYFYDAVGSQLFEAICALPEYYLTRTETAILNGLALELFKRIGPCEIMELGSGSSTKTGLLLDALVQLNYPMVYLPVDVSPSILTTSAEALIDRYPNLKIHGLVADFESLWSHLTDRYEAQRLLIFLGSTLGNLSAAECTLFLEKIAQSLASGDYFLLGVDLRKPIPLLEAAYNDQAGVTAQFNLNLLRRLNRELEGNFDLAQFEHRAFYNSDLHQVEMHLVSRLAQKVTLAALDLSINFEKGETIHTETSRKFDLTELTAALAQLGLPLIQSWQDPQGWFAVVLCTHR